MSQGNEELREMARAALRRAELACRAPQDANEITRCAEQSAKARPECRRQDDVVVQEYRRVLMLLGDAQRRAKEDAQTAPFYDEVYDGVRSLLELGSLTLTDEAAGAWMLERSGLVEWWKSCLARPRPGLHEGRPCPPGDVCDRLALQSCRTLSEIGVTFANCGIDLTFTECTAVAAFPDGIEAFWGLGKTRGALETLGVVDLSAWRSPFPGGDNEQAADSIMRELYHFLYLVAKASIAH